MNGSGDLSVLQFNHQGFTALDAEVLHNTCYADVHVAVFALVVGHSHTGRCVVRPFFVHGVVSLSLETCHTTVCPSRRQCGEDGDDVIVALEQHFGNTAGAAIVTVDLEGRVCVEEVVVATAVVTHFNDIGAGVTESEREVASCVVAIKTAGVGVGLPTHGPSGHIAVSCDLSVVGSLEEIDSFFGCVECAHH